MILLLDGAMGTMIQTYHLTENDFRGERFAHWPIDLLGNNDLLCLTRPDVIEEISTAYAEAGADILTTNTFNANAISLADYGMVSLVREINLAAAAIARRAAESSGRPNVKVAGSIGPTNKTASMSADVDDPGSRAVTYDELLEAYREQIEALAEGGVDILLFETVFDTLNLKAGLEAAAQVSDRTGRQLPVMVSLTIAGRDGRTFSGQTLEAFVASVSHAPVASLGINCSFGPHEIRPWLRELARISPWPVSCHPNAGLPDAEGHYSATPEDMAAIMEEIVDEGLVNIIGGCCGTTPEHIARLRKITRGKTGRLLPKPSPAMRLAGLDMLEISPDTGFVMVGERCNVAGSRKFLRLIREGAIDEALEIARRQILDGAQILDVNMDDGLLDAEVEMRRFLNLIASEPDIARVPVMIDSSDWGVIESGLKCVQGKCIVNSISLKEGEEEFLRRARLIRRRGAAVVVMAFDEKGQADTFERKIEVCARAYRLLTEQADFPPEDIIFDPNVLAIATGMEEHDRYGLDFIRAVKWIKRNLPGAKVSGGLSNLSFSFRGNTPLREAMHAVFLHHAIAAGMDMAIINPASKVTYQTIDPELRQLLDDVVLARTPEAPGQLAEYARSRQIEAASTSSSAVAVESWRSLTVGERLMWSLEHGVSTHLEEDINEILAAGMNPVAVIEGPLMEGMNRVGRLFGEGKMFLPQVVKTARTMKAAVGFLRPEIERRKEGLPESNTGKIIFATVKGDVHDIGKNIVSIVLACNGYEVIDLGVMVPPETIVGTALRERPDIVCLSGLITPSLGEMVRVVREMAAAGLDIPVMVGGATTSRLHTALKIDPFYPGAVIHVADAAQNPIIAARLLNPDTRGKYISELKEEYRNLRDSEAISAPSKILLTLEEARRHRARSLTSTGRGLFHAADRKIISVPVSELIPLINWRAFLTAWKLPASLASAAGIHDCPACEKSWIEAQNDSCGREKAAEALRLVRDALHLLEKGPWTISAVTTFINAHAENETIVTETGVSLPTLRRQMPDEKGQCPAAADFVDAEGEIIGAFAVTVEENETQDSGDPYMGLLRQSVAHRLAEAASEWLHLTAAGGLGIRPAIGYPILPDQSLNLELNRLLAMDEIGITLTENGAMHPSASVSGLYLPSPAARYFMVGAIGDDQLEAYSALRSLSPARARELLGRSVSPSPLTAE